MPILSTARLACVLALALVAVAPRAGAGPGEVLVRLRDAGGMKSAGGAAVSAVLRDAELTPLLRAAPPGFVRPGRARLARTYLVSLPPDADADSAAAALAALDAVELASPNHTLAFAPVSEEHLADPGDPLRVEQWYLDRVGVESAWAVTRGIAEVVVAIIDTGILPHADLDSSLWLNDDPPGNASPADDGVDQDGSGEVEDWEKEDDDDNGYVDDLHGYDFVDAPRIGGPGDAIERDNDVTDDSGHGTAVAGLIGAVADNEIGIAGLAPGCRIMPVRAGFNPGFGAFSGVLEEDDAAAAIVYAAENGAQVINMSFGDTLLPPVIADAIAYAHELGSVLVASAGNTRFNGMHYPSGLDPVIAVGASDIEDRRASFSNFGPALDLLAPGSSLLTTTVAGGEASYVRLSGTSFSAPLVAATAGLIISRDPELRPSEVASILFGSTIDLAWPGFDLDTGHGRLDAGRALAVTRNMSLAIHSPGGAVGVDQQAPVIVTAEGLGLESYTVEVGEGRDPASFTVLATATGRQVVRDTVAIWNAAALPAGEYTLRLRAADTVEGFLEERTLVTVDHTPPAVRDAVALPLWVEDRLVPFIFFATDDLARGAVEITAGGGLEGRRVDGSFVARDHVLRLPEDLPPDLYDLSVLATNSAGLTGEGVELAVEVTGERARVHALTESAPRLPAGELAPRPLDLDGDGFGDLVVMLEDPGVPFGPLAIYESAGDDIYVEAAVLAERLLVRDVGDSDGDGLMEILGSGAGTASLLESPSPGEYPTAEVWTSESGFAIGFAELSGAPVILGIKSDTLLVHRSTGDASAWTRTAFANFSAGQFRSFSPTFFTGDIDGDGATEVVIGDAGGHLIAYRETGGTLVPAYSLALAVEGNPLVDGGDLDGDGRPEVVVDLTVDVDLGSEALLERRRHVVLVFTADPVAGFAIGLSGGGAVTGLAVAGAEMHANALRVASIDDDPESEILLVAAPDLYVFELAGRDRFVPVFYEGAIRSAGVAVGDGDGDGRVEVFARSGGEIVSFEARDPALPGPLPPDGLAARILAGGVVELTWNPGAAAYRVYRAEGPAVDCVPAQQLAEITGPAYLDSTARNLPEVTYRVSAVEGTVEGECSRPLTLVPGAAPAVLSVVAEQARALRITFSLPMGGSADRLENYRLLAPGGDPLTVGSVIATGGDRERLLVLRRGFREPGEHRLLVGVLRSREGVPLAGASEIPFQVPDGIQALEPLYMEAAGTEDGEVVLRLSVEPASPAGTDPASYLLSGGFLIDQARVDGREVRLGLAPSTPLRPGIFELRLDPSLRGTNGELVIPGEGDAREIVVGGAVVAYPNPFRAGSTANGVTIVGLSPGDRVVLLDGLGREILRVDANSQGSAFIPVRDPPGLASGVYLYRVEGTGTLGKLAITR